MAGKKTFLCYAADDEHQVPALLAALNAWDVSFHLLHPTEQPADGLLHYQPTHHTCQHPLCDRQACLTPATSIDVLYALDIKDGSELWHYEVPGIGTLSDDTASTLVPSSPVIVNHVVYFATSAGTVYALSIA
jgi:outer membrane protein assembly factor BamB